MPRAVRRAAIAVLAVAAGLPAGPLSAQIFADAPISCGAQTAFKGCTASFDGWTLRISYVFTDDRRTIATYRMCEVISGHISCAAGEWRSGAVSGRLGARTIALRNGLPFPD
jgi:hypothetical protein